MPKPIPNVALKTALFATTKHQERIAREARIAPQKLSHVIHGRRELDADERRRLVVTLKRHGVESSESELFPQAESVSL